MQILPINNFNQNNSKNLQNTNFQALRRHFHKGLKGEVAEISGVMDMRIKQKPEVAKVVKYLETKGKDLVYRVKTNPKENIYDVDFNTLSPSESLYSDSVAKEFFSGKHELNFDTNEFNFKADDFIKGYENFVEFQKKKSLVNIVNQSIQTTKTEPSLNISNTNKADYQRKTTEFLEHLK